jgi:putative transposase
LTADWCCQLVEEAIERHEKPEIINSDQGSQFTSMEYIEMLLSKGIKISMDGKGRAIDNIFIERLWKSFKYECIYLNAFEDGVQLYKGLEDCFHFYNTERFHQALDYETSESLYKKAA